MALSNCWELARSWIGTSSEINWADLMAPSELHALRASPALRQGLQHVHRMSATGPKNNTSEDIVVVVVVVAAAAAAAVVVVVVKPSEHAWKQTSFGLFVARAERSTFAETANFNLPLSTLKSTMANLMSRTEHNAPKSRVQRRAARKCEETKLGSAFT